jgi:hypothetical protein
MTVSSSPYERGTLPEPRIDASNYDVDMVQ